MAVFYYFIACAMYLVSPRMAYNLSEQVEEHAYHTYDEFLKENELELKSKPPPPSRPRTPALFLFDEFQTGAFIFMIIFVWAIRMTWFFLLTGNPASGKSRRKAAAVDRQPLRRLRQRAKRRGGAHEDDAVLPAAGRDLLRRTPSEAAACVVSADRDAERAVRRLDTEHTDRTCEGLVACSASARPAPPPGGGGGGGTSPVRVGIERQRGDVVSIWDNEAGRVPVSMFRIQPQLPQVHLLPPVTSSYRSRPGPPAASVPRWTPESCRPARSRPRLHEDVQVATAARPTPEAPREAQRNSNERLQL